MAIRRAMATVVALVVAATFAASQIAAQQGQAKPDNKKRSKQEQAEIETLVKLVDGVMTGATPAPSDITMTLEPFFMKSQEQRTFVPFVLTVNGAPKTDSALYVRVVNPAAQPDPKAKKVEYPLGRHSLRTRSAAPGRPGEVEPRVHGDCRDLRRLRRIQGSSA